jgi:glycosyltransferase involved in cell wall biosynthesis
MNDLISVVTVTYNNKMGLQKTLESLIRCQCRPFEVIIVDGGSDDGTCELVSSYCDLLPIKFISERDNGIYDAMNKGRAYVRTPLVHYLNAGDSIAGDVYLECDGPALFPVQILDPVSGIFWHDSVKLSGYGYCHQGILFPRDHAEFNSALIIAGDFESVCKTFQDGLRVLPLRASGYVIYELGGISSVKSEEGNGEIIAVASKFLRKQSYAKIYLYIKLKNVFPRSFRRLVASFLWKKWI